MFLQYYVTESATGNRVNIEIDAASQADLDATRNGWQTVWNTDFILDPQKEKYAAKTEDGEIIALGAIVSGKEALQSTSPISRVSQKATRL